jgi:hypothetical protein
MIWKKAVVLSSKSCGNICLKGLSKTIKNTALPKFGLEASSAKLLTKTAAVVCESSMIQSFYIPRNLQDINTICGQMRNFSL